MIPDHSENKIQQNCLNLLQKLGYKFIDRKENLSLRNGNTKEVLLKEILVKKLDEINKFEYKGKIYKFSKKNLQKAVDDLDADLNEGLNITNKTITNKLLFGESYEEVLPDGTKRSFSLKYIDFENLENNDFYATEEFIVSKIDQNSPTKNRRVDIVLFINGIPIVAIELKNSCASINNGINQLIDEQKNGEIPHLYKFIQLTIAGNSSDAKYATTRADKKFYSIWKEDVSKELESIVKNRNITNLDKLIFSLLRKERLLEIIENFIIFDTNVKKICRYPQYFAIKNILKRVKNINNNKREGGLVWHTQGSGKSLTMVMVTKILAKTYKNSKIIVVTDRTDLDKQIENTFLKSVLEVTQATSGRDLIDKLKSPAKIITTIINKFSLTNKENVVLDGKDIFVLVDEAHRSQSKFMHDDMKSVLKNACFIAFTGTPLLKKEKSSFAKFGKEIHKYTIDEAVKDGVIVPLLYESRFVEQKIFDQKGLDRKFDLITKNLNDDDKLELQKKWAKFQNIASSTQRLEIIAFDIATHFKTTLKGSGKKAMLAASSRYEAIIYNKIFNEHFSDELSSAFVISRNEGEENDGGSKEFIAETFKEIDKIYGNENIYEERVINEFKYGNLDLLIVVSKLLTGFDAPAATVLYIDKPLKEHNLLQAIARVNRVFDESKEYGLIIDYRGLLDELDRSLSAYESLNGFDESDIYHAVVDIKKEIEKIETFDAHIDIIFMSVKHKNDIESYIEILADEKIRSDFLKYLLNLTKAFDLAMSSQKNVFDRNKMKEYKEKIKFYLKLRKIAQLRYHKKLDFGKYEKDMRKLLDTFIGADEAILLTPLVDIFDRKFDNEIKKESNLNAKAQSIASAISAAISDKFDANPAFYDSISNELEKILDEYKNQRISQEEKLNMILALKDKITSSVSTKTYPPEIKGSIPLEAFYDNLFEELNLDDESTIKLAIKVDEIYKNVKMRPEWQNNIEVQKEINFKITELLWNIEDAFDIKFENTEKILEILRKIGIYHYA